MHLTNYAINKYSSNFKQNNDCESDSGHKRSLTSVLRSLKKDCHDTDLLIANIHDIIIKTLICG